MENSKLNSALINQVLHDGWVIEKARPRLPEATGSYHCAAFIARNSKGQRAFVKVPDPTPDKELDAGSALLDLQKRLEIFNYERDLHNKCLKK